MKIIQEILECAGLVYIMLNRLFEEDDIKSEISVLKSK